MPDTLRAPSRSAAVAIGAILLLAAALRFAATTSGLPYRIANDEPFVLGTAIRMMQSGDFNPHFFDYGGLTLYLHLVVGSVTFLIGSLSGDWYSLDQFWQGALAGPARLVTAALGTLTVWLVYRAARRLGHATALVTALALAVLPGHVRESHFALTDVPLTFLVALTWLLSIRAVETAGTRAFFWAGLGAGLAAATKYTGAVVVVMPLVALIGLARGTPRGPRAAAVIGGAAAGFLVASPYTVLALPEFLNGFAALAQSYNLPVSTGEAAATYLKHFRNWFGWPGPAGAAVGSAVLAMSCLGLIAVALRRQARARFAVGAPPLVFGLAYFWLLAEQGSLIYARYALPLAPVLALGIGAGMVTLTSIARHATPVRRRVVAAVLLLALAPAAVSSIGWVRTHGQTHTIDLAAEWIMANVDPDSGVVTEAAMQLPPARRWWSVARLTSRSVEEWVERGARYLVASSAVVEAEPAVWRDARRRLSRTARVLQVFSPGDNRPGPTITVFLVEPTP